MTLLWLIVIPIIAGLLAWPSGRHARSVSLAAMIVEFFLGLSLWLRNPGAASLGGRNVWLEQLDWNWIPRFGVRFHLAMDGLSFVMLMLTFFLGIVAVLASWSEHRTQNGFFYLNLMWVLAGITGVFLAFDLILFYFAWELMLVPMYFLLAVWGSARRAAASLKFFIFTQLSGLLMLISILALHFVHLQTTGVSTFDYMQFIGTRMPPHVAMGIMLGFCAAFAVKLPMVPLHTWLPDAHTEAPTAGSIVIAGLMTKTGAYGFLRFIHPLFPGAAESIAPVAIVLAVIGILYGALMSFAQSDFKRLVAYTSISHLGFVLLGIFIWTPLSLQGAVIQIVSHGLSIAGLFLVAGALYERLGTRDMSAMGGLWSTIPVLSGVGLFFTMGSLGLPGLGNFVAEFLILLGTFRMNAPASIIASTGIIASTIYGVTLVQRAFHSRNIHGWSLPDIRFTEAVAAVLLMVSLLWLGLYPQPLFNAFRPAMVELQVSSK